MTPEQYQRAQRKLTRYGHRFDTSLDQSLPAPLVKTKKGGIAKRQPHYQKKNKTYYQAQCSFRGLKTTGSLEELQALLQARDIGKDAAVKAELDQLDQDVDAHLEQQEELARDQWWQDPARTLDEKAAVDAPRALKEILGQGHAVETSCYVFREYCIGIHNAAASCGLACETVEAPPGFTAGWTSECHVVGQPAAVRERARQISAQTAEAHRATKAREYAAQEAKKAEQKARLQAVQNEAKSSPDWDITGSWNVRCEELATYSSHEPAELSMQIWEDDYRLDEIRDDANDDDSEEEYGYHYLGGEPAGKHQAAKAPEKHPHIPRFHAKFDFGVVEGMMRIFPPDKSRTKSSYSIKANATFDYIWRGRETGEGEIQTTAERDVKQMSFSKHGTKVGGVFWCEYLKPVRFVGMKVAHGRGQKRSSASAWGELSEKAWNRECRSRWH